MPISKDEFRSIDKDGDRDRDSSPLTAPISYISYCRFKPESIKQNLTLCDVYTQSNEYSDSIRRALGTIGDGNLIMDTYSTFHDKNDQAEIARGIQSNTEDNGGVTYLYFTVEDTNQLSRDEKEILQVCDAVFNVKTEVVSDNVQNRLFRFLSATSVWNRY